MCSSPSFTTIKQIHEHDQWHKRVRLWHYRPPLRCTLSTYDSKCECLKQTASQFYVLGILDWWTRLLVAWWDGRRRTSLLSRMGVCRRSIIHVIYKVSEFPIQEVSKVSNVYFHILLAHTEFESKIFSPSPQLNCFLFYIKHLVWPSWTKTFGLLMTWHIKYLRYHTYLILFIIFFFLYSSFEIIF